jgi:hypothetical protein
MQNTQTGRAPIGPTGRRFQKTNSNVSSTINNNRNETPLNIDILGNDERNRFRNNDDDEIKDDLNYARIIQQNQNQNQNPIINEPLFRNNDQDDNEFVRVENQSKIIKNNSNNTIIINEDDSISASDADYDLDRDYIDHNNNNDNINNDNDNLQLSPSLRPGVSTSERRDEYYFQTKIRNSGFWGRVRLRNGTWLSIVGLVCLCISIVLIAVFWRWWWGHQVNMPMRVIAITFLVVGCLCILVGLFSNSLMKNDPTSKLFLGSPFRYVTWIMIGSLVMLVIASVCISMYYTYWHNRYVNTPLISIAIIFYFFGTIIFFWSLRFNFQQFRIARQKIYQPVKQTAEQTDVNVDVDGASQDYTIDDDPTKTLKQMADDSSILDNDETGSTKGKNFRKKVKKLSARPVIAGEDDVVPSQY